MNASTALLPFAAMLALLGTGCPVASEEEPEGSSTDPSEGDESESDSGEPSECLAGNGPTMHTQNVNADEVWSAEDSPHVVVNDFTIFANVTVEACAVVQLAPASTLSIGAGGSLVAAGTSDAIVTFERLDPDAAWSTIEMESGGTVTLEHAVLTGGGDPLNRVPHLHGALIVRGPDDATGAEPTLAVRHVEIIGSQSQGIRLFDQGAFTTDSEDLVITGSAGHAISSEADSAHLIPSGEYADNGDGRILLTVVDPVVHDMTLANPGVPYLVGAPNEAPDFRVFEQNGSVTLTIAAGVELQFLRDGVMRIEPAVGEFPATGSLIAVGTEDEPIVFTSAESDPAPGAWTGLMFGGEPAANARMDHVVVEYAGGSSTSGSASCVYDDGEPNNEAAIRIHGQPTSEFITNTTIVASARHGIDRGWFGDPIDFRSTNDLTDVAACGQTYPRPEVGACPDPVPCG